VFTCLCSYVAVTTPASARDRLLGRRSTRVWREEVILAMPKRGKGSATVGAKQPVDPRKMSKDIVGKKGPNINR
jgi:hypothetical protein